MLHAVVCLLPSAVEGTSDQITVVCLAVSEVDLVGRQTIYAQQQQEQQGGWVGG